MNPELQALSRRGSEAFLAALPRIVLGGLWGSVKGLVTLGLLGGAVSLASWWMWHSADVPSWLVLSLLLTPVVFAFVGVYVGALRGVVRALVQQVEERGLVHHLYAQVKPALVLAARTVSEGTGEKVGEKARSLSDRFFQEELSSWDSPPSWGDRLARRATVRIRRALTDGLLEELGDAQTPQEALHRAESLGVEKIERLLGDFLNDLFSMQVTVAFGVGFLAALLPQLFWWLSL